MALGIVGGAAQPSGPAGPARIEWTVDAILDAAAEAVPDRLMTVCGERRRTFGESVRWTRQLANLLVSRGLGGDQSSVDLPRWESGQDRVALIMHNDLYVDAVVACLRARVVPVNVNHHYTAREVRELLDYIQPRGVIYHRSLGALVGAALPLECELLLELDDAPEIASLPGAVSVEKALAVGVVDHDVTPSPDDVMMVCTGGTTGRPKAVLWRQADAYVSTMTGIEHASLDAVADGVPATSEPYFAVSPLMHTAGLSTVFTAVLAGRTAVVYDNRKKFDAATVLRTAERERVRTLTIVGDAYAGPLVAELERQTYDLSELVGIGTGGAATNPKHKDALLELLPHIVIADAFGSSETGGMAASRSQRDSSSSTFNMHPSGAVVSADRTRFLQPGDPEVGWIARRGRVPLGYLHDREATERTFPVIDGERVAIPGDRAVVEADGAIRLLGRDSLVINTGGEKVFVEEVEEIVRAHPSVADAVVVGRPSERWGHEVVAVVAVRGGAALTQTQLYEFCTQRLARFKAPKALLLVDNVPRLSNGKPDYRQAKELAAERESRDRSSGEQHGLR